MRDITLSDGAYFMKTKQTVKVAIVSVIILVLSGCGFFEKDANLSMSQPFNSKIENSLVNAANSIQYSLAVLAREQETNDPALIDTIPLITPEGGMGGRIDIDWSGPIAPLVYKLATLSDYKLKIFGNEPTIPIIVTITKKNAIIADVLKNASLQARNRASIMVFPENKIVELRYKTI